MQIRETIQAAVDMIDDIHVSGDPLLTVIAFRSDTINIMSIACNMTSKGWALNGLQNPNGFHLCITPVHLTNTNFATDFINDLKWSVQDVKDNPDKSPTGQLGMYDMIRDKIPKGIKGPVLDDIGDIYLNIITSAKKKY